MPRERISLPVRYYRLLVPLPCVVGFPSVAYELLLISIPAAGRHELTAHDPRAGKWPIIGPSYHAREFLEEAVFRAGVPVRGDTIGATILCRMVTEVRAEVVPRPLVDPADKRPGGIALGAWLRVRQRP